MRPPDASAGDGRPNPILTVLAVLVVVLMAGVVLVPHAAGYFFLFDDFALVSIAMKSPVRELFSKAIGGFFRPVALCGVRLETFAFGWRLPAGYAVVSAALHGLNSLLAFVLLRRLGQRREPALLGAAVFLLSPWAGETYFWVSSQFDLYSVLFSFLALWLALRGVDAPRLSGLLAGVVLVAAFGACLSKEMAVTLPGLFVVLCVWRQGLIGLRTRVLVFAAAMAAASAASLLLRSRVIDTLGGAYGSLPSLWKRSDLLATAWSQLRTFALPPGGPVPAFDAAWGIPLALLIVAAFVSSPRESFSAATGLAISLAPVAWSVLEPGSTASGRYLYLPGFFVAALVSLGFSGLYRRGWSPLLWKRVAPYPAVLLLAAGIGILIGQQRLWRQAFRLSRSSVDQVGREKGTARFLHVRNLPYTLLEGPYILKSYAFRLYFGTEELKVRSDAVVFATDGENVKPVRRFDDPFSEYAAPIDATAEKEIVLDLRAR